MVFVKEGEPVAPGEPICVQEEYAPGENTKVDKDGRIISIILGRVFYDKAKRAVSVKPLKSSEIIKIGDQVLAQVRELQDKIALVSILSANGQPLKHPKTAVIIPGRGRSMRGEMKDYVGVGDLVVAQVVTSFMGVIGLSIWKPNLGVVLGLCNRCSGILMKSRRALVCSRCGERQKRKIVPYYGNLERLASMLR